MDNFNTFTTTLGAEGIIQLTIAITVHDKSIQITLKEDQLDVDTAEVTAAEVVPSHLSNRISPFGVRKSILPSIIEWDGGT